MGAEISTLLQGEYMQQLKCVELLTSRHEAPFVRRVGVGHSPRKRIVLYVFMGTLG